MPKPEGYCGKNHCYRKLNFFTASLFAWIPNTFRIMLRSSAFLKYYLFTFAYYLLIWFLQVHDASDSDADIDHMQIDFAMQELVQVVLQSSSNGIDFEVKQTFLTVTKSFYYSAYCDSKTINFHIDKVLFERVEWSVCNILPFIRLLN